jgi:hypothetical protein
MVEIMEINTLWLELILLLIFRGDIVDGAGVTGPTTPKHEDL